MLRELSCREANGRSRRLTVKAPLVALIVLLTIPQVTKLSALGTQQRFAPLRNKPIDRTRSAAQQASQGLPPGRPGQHQTQNFLVTVVDENGVAVSSARVSLKQIEGQAVSEGETDYVGRCEFRNLSSGIYQVRVEKEGFYAVIKNDVQVGQTEEMEITLNHPQEFVERVDVTYSPPAIDPQKTTSSERLSSREIINLPYSVTRDIRYALPFLPGVLQDATGQLHVDGSATRQILDQLDGFNITNPATGLFTMRVSVDALRSVDVQNSRYPAEFGKGSGGILSLTTGMGDDRYRFSATDLVPSFRNRKGIHLNSWTPRATFSGPIRKGKGWFLEALDGEYHLDIVNELPSGADRTTAWRYSNLAKAQVNLTPANILTGSFLINRFRSPHAGLSRFDPLETTVNLNQAAYLFTMKDQSLLPHGMLLEAGVGASQFSSNEQPLGNLPYVISPEGRRGNFYATGRGRSNRLQAMANLFLPPVRWRGRHEFKVGTDIDRLTFDQSFERSPISILRQDGTLSRKITFPGKPSVRRNNLEASGFAQDRWLVSDHWLLEPGVRFDADQIVHRALVSPRLASSYLLTRGGDTKLVGGIGRYYDASSLEFISRPLAGQRADLLYDRRGEELVRPPVQTSFHVHQRHVKAPRFLNWSVGAERKLPASIYLRLEFVQKRGRDGWTFINQGARIANQVSGIFEFRNARRDRYDSLEITARRAFKDGHVLFASYTRSAARSTAVVNFNLDDPIFSQQAGGPLPWDSPNRFISWGWLPLRKGYDLAYSLDWRHGFPFSVVNQDQQLVGQPGSRRFPTYFSLNLHVEHRFQLLGHQWALRAGFNDITNRHNPTAVNNNIDSAHFLTFGGLEGRALTARIRLLGRK